jgi:hypothetical protein
MNIFGSLAWPEIAIDISYGVIAGACTYFIRGIALSVLDIVRKSRKRKTPGHHLNELDRTDRSLALLSGEASPDEVARINALVLDLMNGDNHQYENSLSTALYYSALIAPNIAFPKASDSNYPTNEITRLGNNTLQNDIIIQSDEALPCDPIQLQIV